MFRVLPNCLKGLKPIGLVHPESLFGKKVLVRCDFNIPLKKGKPLNTLRIDRASKTICYLKNSGAKVILVSHIGRDSNKTLRPLSKILYDKYGVDFFDRVDFNSIKRKVEHMKAGEIVLLENIRAFKGETKNDKKFGDDLAGLAEIFVNEAFSVSHREHASIMRPPETLESYIGYQFEKEMEGLSKVFEPKHPFLVLVGGAKFDTKIKLIKALKEKADSIFIGGALSNDIYRALGFEMGDSQVSKLSIKEIKEMINSPKFLWPKDVLVKGGMFEKTKSPKHLKKEDRIVDAGEETFKVLRKKIKESKMIIWNGPFGLYEEGYSYLTKKVAKEIAKSKAVSIVGGGDTLTEITCCQNIKDYDFVSLAGGAMLEFISQKTLPGIEAIREQK